MKELIIVFLIVFWLFFPLGVKLMGSNSYMELTQSEIDSAKNIENSGNIFTQLGGLINGIALYFKFMFLVIPGVPIFIRMGVYALQLISAFVIILIIRGI